MCDRLMGCKSTELNLFVFECNSALQLHLSMHIRSLASIHKFEEFIEPLKISFYFWIVPYCSSNIVHLPITVNSIGRRQKQDPCCRVGFRRHVDICCGQVISDTTIGSRSAIFRS